MKILLLCLTCILTTSAAWPDNSRKANGQLDGSYKEVESFYRKMDKWRKDFLAALARGDYDHLPKTPKFEGHKGKQERNDTTKVLVLRKIIFIKAILVHN